MFGTCYNQAANTVDGLRAMPARQLMMRRDRDVGRSDSSNYDSATVSMHGHVVLKTVARLGRSRNYAGRASLAAAQA